jgi:hypothetical protein
MKFKSSIGEAGRSGVNEGQKVFTVPDANQHIPQAAQNLRSQQDDFEQQPPMRSRNQKFIPEGSQEIDMLTAARLRAQYSQQDEQYQAEILSKQKSRIEMLTGIGRGTKDVKIAYQNGFVTYSLRTLKGYERRMFAEVLENIPRTADGKIFHTGAIDISIAALKHSLYAIDNTDINVLLRCSSYDQETQLQCREEFISSIDAELLLRLYTEYDNLASEVRDGYLTETDHKEVADAISKSS